MTISIRQRAQLKPKSRFSSTQPSAFCSWSHRSVLTETIKSTLLSLKKKKERKKLICFWLCQVACGILVLYSGIEPELGSPQPIHLKKNFYDISHFDRCELIWFWFWFVFPWWLVTVNIFSCVCLPSVCLWKKTC